MNQLKPSWAFLRKLGWTVGAVTWMTFWASVIAVRLLVDGDAWGLAYGVMALAGAVLLGIAWGLAISVEQDEHR